MSPACLNIGKFCCFLKVFHLELFNSFGKFSDAHLLYILTTKNSIAFYILITQQFQAYQTENIEPICLNTYDI